MSFLDVARAGEIAAGDDAALLARHGQTLLALARQSIAWRLRSGAVMRVDPSDYAVELGASRAAFVTLTKVRELRGCVGTLDPWRSLVEDVTQNAAAAATEDFRFSPLAIEELGEISVSVSLLGVPSPMAARSERELLAALRPGIDGLILREGERRALFLPQVWEHLADPPSFVAQLKHKAGLSESYWSPTLAFQRFESTSIAEEDFDSAA